MTALPLFAAGWPQLHSLKVGEQRGPGASCWARRTSTPDRRVSPCCSFARPVAAPASQRRLFPPLMLNDVAVDPPVILAPMAGITNAAFREMHYVHGAPLCASEMVTAGTLLQGHRYALKICEFGPEEPLRSAQLYGVRPEQVKASARWLVEHAGINHLDLNFGCPVKKVTAAGGGAAIPLHPRLLARLVSAAVQGARGVPVTVKMRMGISKDLLTYREAGKVSEAEGAAAVTLHARTADMLYGPHAQWDSIADLVSLLDIPVIGNGDIFEAEDAVRMMEETGCAGVMVGRACLGRPWVLQQIQDVLSGLDPGPDPPLGGALDAINDHCHRLARYWDCEQTAVRQMRKFVSLYLLGYQSAAHLQRRLLATNSLAEWHEAFETTDYDPEERACPAARRHSRLKGNGPPKLQRVALPHGWLESREDAASPTNTSAETACEG